MHNIRKAVLAVSFAALFIMAGTTAHASCPTVTTYYDFTGYYYTLAVDSTCLTTSGSSGVTPVSVSWCYPSYYPGYSYGMGWDNNTTWSFTVPANSYGWKPNWSVSSQVTFSSPTSSAYDEIHGYVYVTHNGYTTSYNWFYLYGAGSTAQYCSNQSTTFSATTGDTITLVIENTRFDSSAVTEASTPTIVNY
jgi:hypothetical protein